MTRPFRFLELPGEIRNLVYRQILDPKGTPVSLYPEQKPSEDIRSLFLVCRKIYIEASSIFYDQVDFEVMAMPRSYNDYFKPSGNIDTLSRPRVIFNRITRINFYIDLDVFRQLNSKSMPDWWIPSNREYRWTQPPQAMNAIRSLGQMPQLRHLRIVFIWSSWWLPRWRRFHMLQDQLQDKSLSLETFLKEQRGPVKRMSADWEWYEGHYPSLSALSFDFVMSGLLSLLPSLCEVVWGSQEPHSKFDALVNGPRYEKKLVRLMKKRAGEMISCRVI
ncbi:MAG: hypothetical protein M1821_009467 [Bathelium mastoideum]|nr:MAG: hypothetical protein M1821_009467 [Bathelium mastoideum]